MSVDLKKNIYIFSKFENYDGTAWNIVKDYMSISSLCTYDKRENIAKKN